MVSFGLFNSKAKIKVPSSITKVFKTAGKGIKKGAKKVVKGAKVAKAVAGVAGDLTNPYKMGKVAINAARGKGVVYPGSKYIGPGNAMNLGKGKTAADRAAYKHDMDYDALLKKGVSKKKLYGGFSTADERLMKRSDLTTKHGVATYGGMLGKKALYKLGLSGKKIQDDGTTRRKRKPKKK